MLNFYDIRSQDVQLDYTIQNKHVTDSDSEKLLLSEQKKIYLKSLSPECFCSLGCYYAEIGNFSKASAYFQVHALEDPFLHASERLWRGDLEITRLEVLPQRFYGETLCNLLMLRLLEDCSIEINFHCDSRLYELVSKCFPKVCVTTHDFCDYENECLNIIQKTNESYAILVPAHHALAKIINKPLIKFPIIRPLLEDQNIALQLFSTSERDKKKIGICWKCGVPGSTRSFDPSDLEPLLSIDDSIFVSLQKGVPKTALNSTLISSRLIAKQFKIDEMSSFYSTLTVASCLDLVVTCDTSVAHLMGISGIPCILLLNSTHDPRWKDGSSWAPYPNVRIFRKSISQTWRELMSIVANSIDGK